MTTPFHKTLFFITLFLPVCVFAGETEPCRPINKEQVISFFDHWNNSLKTKDPEKVTLNYAEDAVLLPTVENGPLVGRSQIKNYFVEFLKKNPVAKIDKRIVKYGCNWALDTGIYTFQITANGKKSDVTARYSYVYENVGGKWLIIHHHSSVMPVLSSNS